MGFFYSHLAAIQNDSEIDFNGAELRRLALQVQLRGEPRRSCKIISFQERGTMGIKIGGYIQKINGKELSYPDFAERYLAKNEPVVVTGLMDDWQACEDWVTHDGKPNLHFFSTHFAKSKVQVLTPF